MQIYYLDNSGFCVVMDHTTLIFDYYHDSASGPRSIENGVMDEKTLRAHESVYVFVSHSHGDHYNRCVLDWRSVNPNIIYLFDEGIRAAGHEGLNDIVFMKEEEVYSDGNIKVKAFGSTDIGISFMAEAEGLTIFHAGDLNYWHWKEEADEAFISQAEADFLNKLERIITDDYNINIMFFPVDYRMGKDGDLGAKHVIKAFEPQVFIPMHFQNKFDKIAAFKAKNIYKDVMIWDIKKRGDTLRLI